MGHKIPVANPMKSIEIENFALKIIKRFQPEALKKPIPFDIERLTDVYLEELCGVEVDYRHLEWYIHAYTDFQNMKIVINSSLVDDPSQIRFTRSTMAHEVGHALLHINQFRRNNNIVKSITGKDANLKLYREKDIPVYKNPEWQAWKFAEALLMPKDMFEKAKQDSSIKELANLFQLNPAFIQTRDRALLRLKK
jgi:Zn-dependent peptidase ImmA (M78 family)